MNKNVNLILGGTMSLLCAGACSTKQNEKYNILFITADDLGYESLGYTGNDTPDISPNVDRLASESMQFHNAFVTASISQPSRCCWITGRYPHHNGAIGFNPVSNDNPMLGREMRRTGYYTALYGKGTHFAPITAEHWDDCVPELPGYGRDADEFERVVAKSITAAEKRNLPFFIVANCADPHRPFHGTPNDYKGVPLPSRVYAPEEVDVPGYLMDIPETREELAHYYSSVKRMDDIVGRMLSVLDSMGKRGNTIVIFASDNGAALPFAKGSCYLQSHKTPLLIRYPGNRPSVDTVHFISGIDMMPTILDMAQADKVGGMDGHSFYPLLEGKIMPEFEHVNVVYHRDHFVHTEQRAYHDKKWGYIYNEWRAWEYERKINFVADNNIGMFGSAKADSVRVRRDFYLRRAPEELYDYENDPFSLHNLAEDPQYKEVLEDMRSKMFQWMDKMNDYCWSGYNMYLQQMRREGK
ncbi:MAG: sulfatase [Candidatus Cryptobacteroides sp.]